MSEKYYVVSNSELHALCVAAEIAFKSLPPDGNYRFEDCFEACRARPFEKYQAVVEAGQAMREARIAEHYLEHNKYELGCKKWDAATKEDV